MKIKLCIIFILINLISIPKAYSEIIDRVVASIGTDAITLYDIDRDGEAIFKSIIQTSNTQDVEAKLYSARKKILDKLIENLLLLREAESLAIEVNDEEVNGAIEKILKENSLTHEELLIALKREGTSYENYRKKMRAQIIRAKVIDRKVRASVAVSDEDINSYYETNRYDLTNDDEVRARHILFAVPKGAEKSFVDAARIKAEKVLKMAKEGADFEELAMKYSEGPSSVNGGDLGYFRRGDMVKEFSDEAFLLNKGEISGLVLSQFGFHIIKIVDRRKAPPVSLEETKEKIRGILYNKKFEAAIAGYIQELRDRAEINNLL